MGRLILAIFVGKLISFLSRTFKIGGGSAAPGLYALKIDPNLVGKLQKQIPSSVIITGTNGKTTTAKLLAHFISQGKTRVIRNSTGSNLERGIASSLIQSVSFFGKIDKDLAIWELDEAAFNSTVFKIRPQIIIFLNAFRDQLDRYGEVDSVVRKWKETLSKMDWKPKVLLNGSDDNTLSLKKVVGIDSIIFGVLNNLVFKEKSYEQVLSSGDSATKKEKFDFEARVLEIKNLEGIEFKVVFDGIEIEYFLPIPGIYHVYDFLAAFAAYYYLNLPIEKIVDSLKNYHPAFGRVEKFKWKSLEGTIFLIKNPAGANLVIETVIPQVYDNDLILIALNDNFADGTDVSWIWDSEFEKIYTRKRIKFVCSGSRADDLAVRLKYSGVSVDQIIVEPEIKKALNQALENTKGRLFVLPTYTALLELQKILTNKGIKKHYWKEQG